MCADNIKRIYGKIALVIIPVLLLAATVVISFIIAEDAFAKERYSEDTSQAAAVSNECLNLIFDSNEDIDNAVGVGNCAGTVSQQDESGSASSPITSQIADPTIELQRPTTTQPPLTGQSCVSCFSPLTAAQVSQLERLIPIIVPSDPGTNTIEELCEVLIGLDFDKKLLVLNRLHDILGDLNPSLSDGTIASIVECVFTSIT
jgi:hypothetical protein